MQTKHVQQREQELEEISLWLVKKIASCAHLAPSEISVYESFASYGLSSTDAVSISGELEEWLGQKLQPTLLYNYPTIDLLARALIDPNSVAPLPTREARDHNAVTTRDIAIIGMAGRFPGAANVDEFWHNLRSGIESISVFSSEELLATGADADAIAHPAYVPARPVLKAEEVECFDAAFFGYSPHEAAITDPQHRIFLECSWEAIERAGYDPTTYDGLIGVYAGCNLSTYLMALAATEHIRGLDDYQIAIGHDKDSLTSTVSYKLNLKGPSFAVQTFCSTSLVAIYLACQSLIHDECDLALAGGVSVRVPGKIGYRYHEGGMESKDGHCRAFDSEAKGTLFGDGAGVVVLKRLQDALRDGDTIDAVIKGSAINNDGSVKMSYTAPGVVGQAAAITRALEQSGIDASTVGYIEAHGSATELGDPIEVTALTKAFRQYTNKQGYCALGSVKTNIGHMDRAAGVAGLIKVAQALKHKEIPPTLHVQTPNPKLELEQSPFFLNTSLKPWTSEHRVRRAGVNSLGLGGTNAHVVLEEAPEQPETSTSRPWQLLTLSARTDSALETMTHNLRQHLLEHNDVSLADVAYTLQAGRKKFEQRRVVLCQGREEALRLLADPNSAQVLDQAQRRTDSQAIFLLPGVGEQYPRMAQELYQQEPFFRTEVDRCCQMLHLLLGMDLRSLLYPEGDTLHTNTTRTGEQIDLRALLRRNSATPLPADASALTRTELAQPAIFVIEYALARLLMHWGIMPQAMLGYSLGEYVAATLAGVLSLEDALTLVARRARLIAAQPAGAMLSVALAEEDILAYLQQHAQFEIDLAVVAAPQTCVVAGTPEMIKALAACLAQDEIACFRVETTHAFHSRMLTPVKKALTQLVKGMLLCPPAIPYISNVTGTWITNQQATSPEYWAEHMCQTVRFADGVGCLLQKTPHLFLEVGVGQTLGSFVRQHPACDRERMTQIFATQPAREGEKGYVFFMTSLGRLWLAGLNLDWQRFYEGERRRRIPLPTYPFERQRYWIDVQDWRQRPASSTKGQNLLLAGERKADISQWFSVPGWKQALPLMPPVEQATSTRWLVFLDETGTGEALSQSFAAAGCQVITVTPGTAFKQMGDGHYQVHPCNQLDYQRLLQELSARQSLPTRILHCWSVSAADTHLSTQQQLDLSFYSLLALAQALGETKIDQCTLSILANGMYDVLGQETLIPAKATLLGPCMVIPQEYTTLRCHLIEIALPTPSNASALETVLAQLEQELALETVERIVALRGTRRWLPTFEEVQLPAPVHARQGLREHGVYLITGGLGGIGLALADHLATTVQARLILVSRSELPTRDLWPALLNTEVEDSPLRLRLTAIQHMESLGAEVLVMAADVANAAQMQHVLAQSRATFGELHGVFHLAGVPGVGLIQLKTPAAAAAVLAPKVQGTLVLDQLLHTTPLDFCLLFSSITAVTGGPGQVDYSAANAFMDAYARSRHAQYPVVAIDWSEWEWNAWSDGLAGYDEATRTFFEKNRRTFGISLKEGAAIFQRLLNSAFAQVVVSTQDIQALVALGATYNVHSELPWQQNNLQTAVTYPRPALKNSYIAPRNDDERKMVRIWEGLLAIDGIGIYDNFFDLGGNSLLGVNLLIQVRKEFTIEQLPAYVLYEASCIEAMTQYLTQGKQGITVNALDERSSKRQSLIKKRIREKNA